MHFQIQIVKTLWKREKGSKETRGQKIVKKLWKQSSKYFWLVYLEIEGTPGSPPKRHGGMRSVDSYRNYDTYKFV